MSTTAGQVVMTEGEPGDTFYAVADGAFDIVHAGKLMCTVERGASFGEVALLADVPRTATITCTRHGSLLAIQRAPFLVAVTGSDSCRRAAWGVIRTMGLGSMRIGIAALNAATAAESTSDRQQGPSDPSGGSRRRRDRRAPAQMDRGRSSGRRSCASTRPMARRPNTGARWFVTRRPSGRAPT
jgi:CRP-like cAMP-binding protein